MLRPRIIPTLLVQGEGLVKTIKFDDPKYVGDPLNAVRIFNEKQVDELVVLDIDATIEGRKPNLQLIESLATECRMPLCYGGGVSTAQQIEEIVSLGVEKVALGYAAIHDPDLIRVAAEHVGRQSVVVILDVRRNRWGGGYTLYTSRGKKKVSASIEKVIEQIQSLGAGELILNSIDRDGTLSGYDIKLAKKVAAITQIPLTILGGASSIEDMLQLRKVTPHVGLAAGSMFVLKGSYRAVLISYLDPDEKARVISLET